MMGLCTQKMNLKLLSIIQFEWPKLKYNSYLLIYLFLKEEILTCHGSCAWQWQAGRLGTAIHHLVLHRGPASDKTGGRLYYTRHTRSACHPHLQGDKLVQHCREWGSSQWAVRKSCSASTQWKNKHPSTLLPHFKKTQSSSEKKCSIN